MIINRNKESDLRLLKAVSETVSTINKKLKKEGSTKRFRVRTVQKPIEGDDPYAWKYDNRFMRGKPRREEDLPMRSVHIHNRGINA